MTSLTWSAVPWTSWSWKFWPLEGAVPLQNSIQCIRQRGFKRLIPVVFVLVLFLKHSAAHAQDMQCFLYSNSSWCVKCFGLLYEGNWLISCVQHRTNFLAIITVSRMTAAYIRVILQSAEVYLTPNKYRSPGFDVAWEYIKHATWTCNLIYSLLLSNVSPPAFCAWTCKTKHNYPCKERAASQSWWHYKLQKDIYDIACGWSLLMYKISRLKLQRVFGQQWQSAV